MGIRDPGNPQKGPTFAAAPWAIPVAGIADPEISLAEARLLAGEAGLALASVTGSEPFPGLQEMLEEHIAAGRLAGLDWFDPARAEVAADPRRLHVEAQSVVSLGLPYYGGPVDKPADAPRGRIARYAWGVDYHRIFRKRLKTFRDLLEGRLARKVDARLLSDTARIVDRAVAVRSGLGWYGKHSCVIVPGHGSWVMLGEAMLDVAVERSQPVDRDCGRCTRCLDACPTGAIVAPYIVETPRCLSFQTIEQRGAIPLEIRPLLGDWVFGCDICQEVCPYTGAASISHDADFAPASVDNAFPRLDWLLTMTESEFRAAFARTAVLRAKRRGMARNAAVALGNSGNPEMAPVLSEALHRHDEPLVRAHAAWALGQIRGRSVRESLTRALQRETDPDAQSEIMRALEQS
ncbi:MAG: tRNA epoxyqueuosine(34) reductase QueG [Thermomicrobiales bacterium]